MSTDAKPIKPVRVHKAKYTSQDVRQQALEARDELLANVEFLMEAIREDRYKLQRYKDRFGDLKYRPIVSQGKPEHSIEPVYGNPTEVTIEPLASVYRATINSLLQSIRLIQSEIIPDDDAEADTARAKSGQEHELTVKRRASLREEFSSAASTATVPEAQNDDEDATELVETPKTSSKRTTRTAIESATRTEPKADPAPIAPTSPSPQARPWRTKPPVLVPSNPSVDKEPTQSIPAAQPQKVSLQNPETLDPDSERIRADLNRLRQNSTSRLGALSKKYAKRDKDDED
jgi:hypothetical protein